MNPAFQTANIQAVLFDTFGTTVDWRGSMIAHLERFGRKRNRKADWAGLADGWRAQYKPAIQAVREGRAAWANFDVLHRQALDELLPQFGLTSLSDEERNDLVHGWELLAPWPDAVAGLSRLKRKFIIGPLSSRNVRQLTNMAKHSGWPWGVIVGADTFHRYKPDPELYRGAIALLACPAEAVLMGAARDNDLEAARRCGMKTAFVRRPTKKPSPERTGKSSPRILRTSLFSLESEQRSETQYGFDLNGEHAWQSWSIRILASSCRASPGVKAPSTRRVARNTEQRWWAA